MNKIVFLYLFLLLGQAKAVQFEGFEFPLVVNVENESLVLNGLALRKATFLEIRILAAGLYLPQFASESSAVEKMDGRKQLQLCFLKNLSAKTIAKVWTEELMKNCESSCSVIKEKARDLEKIITGIKKNDLLTISFEKDRLDFRLNHQKRGWIDGSEFVLAFLRIWIGSRPINEDFKKDLLKQSLR